MTGRRLADVPAPALPWLLTVARNVVIDQFRAAARQQSVTAELQAWASEPQAGSSDVADQVAERLTVLTALATLSEADRELLTLLAWQGLTPRQAAQVVGGQPGQRRQCRRRRAPRRATRAGAAVANRAASARPGNLVTTSQLVIAPCEPSSDRGASEPAAFLAEPGEPGCAIGQCGRSVRPSAQGACAVRHWWQWCPGHCAQRA